MTKHEAITALFGQWNAVTVYPETVAGLQQFLTDSNILHFSAKELTSNRNLPNAVLLPTRIWWYRAAAPCLILEKCRAITGDPVDLRYWWRPTTFTGIDVNKISGGSPKSDHITSHAVDVDFRSEHHLRDALEVILIPLFKLKSFGLSLGVGKVRLHLGVHSPLGQRGWLYGGVTADTAKLLKANGIIK